MCDDITFITPITSDDVVLSSIADCCSFGLWPTASDVIVEAGEATSGGKHYQWDRSIALPNSCLCGVDLQGLLRRAGIAYEVDPCGLIVRTGRPPTPDHTWEDFTAALAAVANRTRLQMSWLAVARLKDYELITMETPLGGRLEITEDGRAWHQALQEGATT